MAGRLAFGRQSAGAEPGRSAPRKDTPSGPQRENPPGPATEWARKARRDPSRRSARSAEAQGAAHGLAVSALDSVEPDNDWPVRLALLQSEIAYSEDAGEAQRRQLGVELAAIGASSDEDREYLHEQGAALLHRSGKNAADGDSAGR